MLLENNTAQVGAAGFAPCTFTNNPAESTNAIIKRWTGGKKLKVDELCMMLKEDATAQFEELKKGYMGLSKKYILKSYAAKSESTVKVVQKRKGAPLYDILLEADDGSEDLCNNSGTSDAEKEIATPTNNR